MTTGKTIALTRWTFVDKVMSVQLLSRSKKKKKKTGQQEYWKFYRAGPLNHSQNIYGCISQCPSGKHKPLQRFQTERALMQGLEKGCKYKRKRGWLCCDRKAAAMTAATFRHYSNWTWIQESTLHWGAHTQSHCCCKKTPLLLLLELLCHHLVRIQALRSPLRSWLSPCCFCPKHIQKLGRNDLLFPPASSIFYQDIMQNHL